MQCLILAAGYATRLYPLTENFPKPLLEIQGKPILDWLIDDLETTGKISGYAVVSNHRFKTCFDEWASKRPQRIAVVDDGTSTNETRLGAVRDIQFAIDALKLDDDLLVMAGDNLLDFSLAHFVRYALEKQTSCVMRYYEHDEMRLLRTGVLAIDEKDRILEMTEKSPTPATHWACPAFYCFRREDVGLVKTAIAEGCPVDAPGSFIAWLCHRVPVHAMEMPGRRFDIGNLASYQEVQQNYRGIAQ
ncbi:MAG: NTP transferase domain-containing protein [Victivallales bacterium]|nr:NTP transferase domain-containing protein [Victivallales bacterium]